MKPVIEREDLTEDVLRLAEDISDGFYRDFKERVALAAYLENIGDQARVSKYFIKDLRGANKYLKGNYFHVKDPRLVDMLHLIMPKIVRSVQQVVTIST